MCKIFFEYPMIISTLDMTSIFLTAISFQSNILIQILKMYIETSKFTIIIYEIKDFRRKKSIKTIKIADEVLVLEMDY